jgi:Spy/CpxP family protein refolding chaperone
MRKLFIALLVATFVSAGSTLAQENPPDPPRHPPMPGMGKPDVFAKLKLSDEQKEQMKNIRFETQKKEIELRSKLALSKLELGRLAMSDAPDKAAIEKKMNEVVANEASLKMNKLNGWFEANKNLTPEQQKVWREFLRLEVRAGAAHEGKGRMERERRP